MLSMWIPEENGQQYLSELGASLDAISRQEVRDRHVAVTLEEMGKRSGDPASFTHLLDRQFKDFIERGHDELSQKQFKRGNYGLFFFHILLIVYYV